MNFGLYVLAFVCPPIYFFVSKRPGAGIVHCFLFLVSVILAITLIGIPIAIIIWITCIIHALWNVRRQLVTAQAQIMAKRMAEEMRTQPLPVSNVPPRPPVVR